MEDAYRFTQEIVTNKPECPLNIAIGNVSGDVDSVVGAVLMGMWLTYKKGFYNKEYAN